MMLTPKLGRWIRRRLRALSILPVMLLSLSLTLPACGDKEAVDPSHLAEIAQAEEDAESEKSQRLLAESRLGTVLWLAVLGSGAALILGLAIGSSRRETDGPETDI